MNKWILSLLSISLCAGCKLFAEEIIDSETIEITTTIDEATVSCGNTQADDEPVACNCGHNRKKDKTSARCSNCPPNANLAKCSCTDCSCAKALVSDEEPAARCGKRPPRVLALAVDEEIVEGALTIDEDAVEIEVACNEEIVEGALASDKEVIEDQLACGEEIVEGALAADEEVIEDQLACGEEIVEGSLAADEEVIEAVENELACGEEIAEDAFASSEISNDQEPAVA